VARVGPCSNMRTRAEKYASSSGAAVANQPRRFFAVESARLGHALRPTDRLAIVGDRLLGPRHRNVLPIREVWIYPPRN